MSSRPKIPAAMKRAIKEEAGYRCAVPTCRDKGPFDFEHIDPWSEVKKHEFQNIVLLCVGCHARVTRGEISKSAIKVYKRNLAIISGRYSLFEMRYIERLFNMKPSFNGEAIVVQAADVKLPLPYVLSDAELIHMDGLIKDQYVSVTDFPTIKGRDFLVDAIDSIPNQDESASAMPEMIKSMIGAKQYLVTPTVAGLQFVSDFFSGNSIE